MKRTKRFMAVAFMVAMSVASAQAEKVAQTIWTAGNTTLTFIYHETEYNEGDTFNGETVTNVWKGDKLSQQYKISSWGFIDPDNRNDDVKINMTTAVFHESFKDFTPTNTSYWFYNCKMLTVIEDLEYLNTGNVTSMNRMFYKCSSLISLDISHFDTGNVMNMGGMFSGCRSLKNLSLGSSFVVDKVASYESMLFSVSELKIYVDSEVKATVDASLEKLGFKEKNGYTTTTDMPQTVSGNGKDYWATYYNSIASMTVPEGVEAYTTNVDGDELVLTKIENGIVAKGNAVVLKSATAEIVLDVNTAPKNIIEGNELQGVDVDTAAPTNCMTLGVEGNKAGLWRPQEEETQVKGHEAFIVYADNEDVKGFPFPGETGETVGIRMLDVQANTAKTYTLDGCSTSSASKGVTIVRLSDGTVKKVLVK